MIEFLVALAATLHGAIDCQREQRDDLLIDQITVATVTGGFDSYKDKDGTIVHIPLVRIHADRMTCRYMTKETT